MGWSLERRREGLAGGVVVLRCAALVCIDPADDAAWIVVGHRAVVKGEEELEAVSVLLRGLVGKAELVICEGIVANVQGKAVDECRCRCFDVVVPIRLCVAGVVAHDDMSEDVFAMASAYCSQQCQ